MGCRSSIAALFGALVLAACAAPANPVASPRTTQPDPVARVRTVFADLAADRPGCSAAIAEGGEVGVIALDEPLRDYLPDLPTWAERATLRQMLHHTSGIPDYIGLLVDAGIQPTEAATVEQAMQQVRAVTELDFEPGSQFSSSNSNYFLFSQVVERATGRSLAKELADRVFGPLELAAVMDPTAAIPGKARSYERRGDQWVVADSPGSRPVMVRCRPRRLSSCAGRKSTGRPRSAARIYSPSAAMGPSSWGSFHV